MSIHKILIRMCFPADENMTYELFFDMNDHNKARLCSGYHMRMACRRSVFDPRTREFIFGVKTWLSTLETVYLLWDVVAQWLERRLETWANLFTPHCLCL